MRRCVSLPLFRGLGWCGSVLLHPRKWNEKEYFSSQYIDRICPLEPGGVLLHVEDDGSLRAAEARKGRGIWAQAETGLRAGLRQARWERTRQLLFYSLDILVCNLLPWYSLLKRISRVSCILAGCFVFRNLFILIFRIVLFFFFVGWLSVLAFFISPPLLRLTFLKTSLVIQTSQRSHICFFSREVFFVLFPPSFLTFLVFPATVPLFIR